MKSWLIILLILPLSSFAQFNKEPIKRDTSFSVWSAWQKVKKDFPHAVPVKEFRNLSIKEERNVAYSTIGNRELHADLFYPEERSTEKIPAVVLIHGGGWASGDKSHLVPMAQKLAKAGFLAATVEYRLSPEAKYPAGVNDLKTAVKWLKFNADKYHIDTSKIASLGTSAGATLATLIGTTSGNAKYRTNKTYPGISDKVHAIINIDGVVDFTHPAESGKDQDPDKPSAGARWFGFTYKQNPTIWIEASPINYVGKDTPPTLFINSAIPRFHAGREYFIHVLDKNKIEYKIVTIPETPHPFWLFHPWFDEAWPLITQFLIKVFEE